MNVPPKREDEEAATEDGLQAAVAGPPWDLSSEYPAADSAEIEGDLSDLSRLLDELEALNPVLEAALPEVPTLAVDEAAETLDAARAIYKLAEKADLLVRNPSEFASCLLSVDANDEEAQVLQGRLQACQKRFEELAEPLSQFVDLIPDVVLELYLSDDAVRPSEFIARHSRERRHERLSVAEEKLVSGLAQDGIHAWGRLYDQISGTLQCELGEDGAPRTMGLAEASGLLEKSDPAQRQSAWRAINLAWESQAESCAAALNAIAGWRLEMVRKRSHTREVHFLDGPVHDNRISRSTLDTLISVAEEASSLARRAARAMGRAYGGDRIGPWDNRAPAPRLGSGEAPMSFGDGVGLIAEAFAGVDAEMGAFVHKMVDERWIEGTVSPHKRPGAYCTGFAKSRTPRVYMTYTGSPSDVMTLAHELGHGYHSWVMRDLPRCQRRYGMSLAETASTFGEATVRDALLGQASSRQSRLDIQWEEMAALTSFLLNIPARFSFEKELYQRREERPLLPAELGSLMSQAWERWYGDSLSEPDPWFWATKLHFYISELSFYNFPYLFGYLFSTGVYLRRELYGDEFHSRYVALLRDTGRMTAEEVARRHLDVDLSVPDFWRDAVARLEPRVAAFEDLMEECRQ